MASAHRSRSNPAGKGAVNAHPVPRPRLPSTGRMDHTKGSPEHPAAPTRDPGSMGCFGLAQLAQTGWGQGNTALGDVWLLPGTARGQQLCRHPSKPTRKFPERFPVRRHCWMIAFSTPEPQPGFSPAAVPRGCPVPGGLRARSRARLPGVRGAERGIAELFSTGSSCCLAAPRGTASSLAPPEPRPLQSCLCLRAPDVFIRTVSSPGRRRSPRPRTHVRCANSCCCSREYPASLSPCRA